MYQFVRSQLLDRKTLRAIGAGAFLEVINYGNRLC